MKITTFGGALAALIFSSATMQAAPAQSKSWVKLTTQLGPQSFKVGQPIPVTLEAKNTHVKGAYLKFSSGQRYDLQLFPIGKTEPIYTWSASRMFLQSLGSIWLKPGEKTTFKTEIGNEMGAIPAGNYRLQSHLTNSSNIQAAPVAFEIVAPKIQFSAKTDKTVYKKGETVKIDFSLTNSDSQPKTFTFANGQTYDIFVKNAAGEAVWNWSANVRFLMVSRPITFAAGQTQKWSEEWNGQSLSDFQIKPGKYSVEVVYEAQPRISAPPIAIEIVE